MVRCRWHVLESADRRQAGRRQDISRCVVRLRPDRRAGVRIRDRSVYGGRIALLQRRTGAGIPARAARGGGRISRARSEEHTSELQSLMRISYAVFCLKKKKKDKQTNNKA